MVDQSIQDVVRLASIVDVNLVDSTPVFLDSADWASILEDHDYKLDNDRKVVLYPYHSRNSSFDEKFRIVIERELNRPIDLLIIDCCNKGAGAVHVVEHMTNALMSAVGGAEGGGQPFPPILIVTSQGIAQVARLHDAVTKKGLRGKVWSLTFDAPVAGDDSKEIYETFEKIADLISDRISPASQSVLKKTVAASVIRRRGVFVDLQKRSLNKFYAFQYIVEPDGIDALMELIPGFLFDKQIKKVIVDTSSSHWMENVGYRLQQATDAMGICVLISSNSHPVSCSSSSHSHQVDERTLVLCGVTNNGGVATRIAEKYAIDLDSQNILRMAIFSAPDEGQCLSSDKDIWHKASFDSGEWYYLFRVEIREHSKRAWQPSASELLHETYDLGKSYADSFAPRELCTQADLPGVFGNHVGLWDLLIGLGVKQEPSHPCLWRTNRLRVQWIPDLSMVDEFDANWLAELIIQRFMAILGLASTDRRNLVIIVPERTNDLGLGAERVIEAMVTSRNVRTVKISRDLLTRSDAALDADTKFLLHAWREATLVGFDELAVTCSTLSRLDNLVTDAGYDIRCFGTVFDALAPGRVSLSEQHFSLYRWIPSRFVKEESE